MHQGRRQALLPSCFSIGLSALATARCPPDKYPSFREDTSVGLRLRISTLNPTHLRDFYPLHGYTSLPLVTLHRCIPGRIVVDIALLARAS